MINAEKSVLKIFSCLPIVSLLRMHKISLSALVSVSLGILVVEFHKAL